MLKTETNTSAIERSIRSAFRKSLQHHAFDVERFTTHFEHGQWWVIATPAERMERDEMTYSVVDTSNGFDFEEV